MNEHENFDELLQQYETMVREESIAQLRHEQAQLAQLDARMRLQQWLALQLQAVDDARA